MSRILVTGSAGTLGTRLVTELKARGHEVTGADLRHWPGEIRTDMADWGQVQRAFQIMPEVCFHLAGEFGRVNGNEYAEQLWRTNCLGTHNVIDMCIRVKCRLIFASSSEAYGYLADMGSLQETLLIANCPEFHNEYALTKFTNEQQIRIARRHGLCATILRFFNVYGPGEYYSDYRSVVCLFIYRALKGLPISVYSETRRSFLYIDDWARAVANVLDVEDDTFNIASTRSVNMGELMKIVSAELGHPRVQITFKDTEPHNVRDKVANVDKAARLLGLTDLVSLEEGIKRTVEWMRNTYE